MKKLLIVSIFIVLAMLIYIKPGIATVIDVNDGSVSDWGVDLSAAGADQAGYLDTDLPDSGIYYVTEDNADSDSGWIEVEPGWSNGNTYDAEAMYYYTDGTYGYVAIITGLPETGTLYGPGDIAIDGGDGISDGYEFGINLDTETLELVNVWENVSYPQHADANPYAIADGDELGTVDLMYSGEINGHYIIEAKFLLADAGLSAGDPISLHWTMRCGNDALNLKVPEPATMLLLGTGLFGIIGIGRVRMRKRESMA